MRRLGKLRMFQHTAAPERRAHGKADEDHDRDRFLINRAGTKCEARMVPFLRRRRGDDRAGQRRSDLEPRSGCLGGMAQFGRTAPVADGRRLGSDLPQFAAGSQAEHKNRLAAHVCGCETRNEEEGT
jgi:hypothetical protein